MTSKFLAMLMTGICVSTCAFAAEGMHKIHVTLFGQPCLLEGPVDESILKAVHAISPEQVYPTFEPGEKSAKVKAALDKLHSGKELPNGLDLYREQLAKRMEAQAAFLKGLEEALKQKKAEPLLTGTKTFIPEGKLKTFEASAKKLEANLTAPQRKELLEQLFTQFGETLPSDPEEEFHKAIHRMKIQYMCSFEDSGSDESAE